MERSQQLFGNGFDEKDDVILILPLFTGMQEPWYDYSVLDHPYGLAVPCLTN